VSFDCTSLRVVSSVRVSCALILVIAASRTWRRLKGTKQLPKVIVGVRFNDGIEVIHMPANHAA